MAATFILRDAVAAADLRSHRARGTRPRRPAGSAAV